MPENYDETLLSAIERYKNGEETQGDRKIIGQALASKQIEFSPAEDSKIIGQAGGADFGESNEVRVSGSVIGTQSISGFSAEQVIELLKLYDPNQETSDDSATEKTNKKRKIIITTAIAATVIAAFFGGLYWADLIPPIKKQTPVSTSDVVIIPGTGGSPTPTWTSTQFPTSTHFPTPTDIPPSSTKTQTSTFTPLLDDTSTPTPTPTPRTAASICEQQEKILLSALNSELVNEALNTNMRNPPKQWTNEARNSVQEYFNKIKESIAFSEIHSVDINDHSVSPEITVYDGVCDINFDVTFLLSNYSYDCKAKDGIYPQEQYLPIKSSESKANIEFIYYSEENIKHQINHLKLDIGNEILKLCEIEP